MVRLQEPVSLVIKSASRLGNETFHVSFRARLGTVSGDVASQTCDDEDMCKYCVGIVESCVCRRDAL